MRSRMIVERSTPYRSAASPTVVSPRTSCSQISYFCSGVRNRLARRPSRSVPRSCSVTIRPSSSGQQPERMLSDPNPVLYRKVRRRPGVGRRRPWTTLQARLTGPLRNHLDRRRCRRRRLQPPLPRHLQTTGMGWLLASVALVALSLVVLAAGRYGPRRLADAGRRLVACTVGCPAPPRADRRHADSGGPARHHLGSQGAGFGGQRGRGWGPETVAPGGPGGRGGTRRSPGHGPVGGSTASTTVRNG